MIAYDWWAYNFWRFVLVQEEVAKLAETAIAFPPMQAGASFNLDNYQEADRGRPGRACAVMSR